MTAYNYALFCANVERIHGSACWVSRIVSQRPMAIPTAWERCDGPMDGHHLAVPKRMLKREFPKQAIWGRPWRQTVREQEAEPLRWHPFDPRNDDLNRTAPRICDLGDLLNDGRNGVPACRHHHDLLENHILRLRREELPPQAEEFAQELGLGWWLDRSFGALPHVIQPEDRVPALDYDDPDSPVYRDLGGAW